MVAKKLSLTLALGLLLSGGSAFAQDQITVQKSVIDTLRYAPRLEMIKHNRDAVDQDLVPRCFKWVGALNP